MECGTTYNSREIRFQHRQKVIKIIMDWPRSHLSLKGLAKDFDVCQKAQSARLSAGWLQGQVKTTLVPEYGPQIIIWLRKMMLLHLKTLNAYTRRRNSSERSKKSIVCIESNNAFVRISLQVTSKNTVARTTLTECNSDRCILFTLSRPYSLQFCHLTDLSMC